MKKIIVTSFFSAVGYTHTLFASSARSIFYDKEGNGIPNETLRNGDIHIDDIPNAGLAAINNMLYLVGTISIFFILVGAVVYVFGGLFEQAKEFGKKAIRMAIIGAIISWSAWFMVNFIIDNLA